MVIECIGPRENVYEEPGLLAEQLPRLPAQPPLVAQPEQPIQVVIVYVDVWNPVVGHNVDPHPEAPQLPSHRSRTSRGTASHPPCPPPCSPPPRRGPSAQNTPGKYTRGTHCYQCTRQGPSTALSESSSQHYTGLYSGSPSASYMVCPPYREAM